MASQKKSPHTKKRPQKKTISGIIQVTRKGVGYLAWPQNTSDKDIEIGTQDLHGALNGDTVDVALTKVFPRPKGEVRVVKERAKEEFVGTLTKAGTTWRVIASDQKMYRPIQVRVVPEGTTEGVKVLVRLLSFDGSSDPQGEILQVLGESGEHRVEMNAIVLERGFAVVFPADVQLEAKRVQENHVRRMQEESSKRADYRNVTTFTIDPVDAKDFDDALSVKMLENGEYEIGIHIADVTFFVEPGGVIDTEAQKRGTSVYLVDETIPMLPHELSNDVCSLVEGKDRLTFSTIVRMNKEGEVLERRFEKTIIRSNKRFSYEEAQSILDAGTGPYHEELLVLRSLARKLKQEREREGALEFSTSEVRFTLNDKGEPIAIERKVQIETNSLIEEFMLLANQEVSTYVSNLIKNAPEKNFVFLYRIHDVPKEDKIQELEVFVRALGYQFAQTKGRYKPRDIVRLLKSIEGTPEENLIKTATLRSMAKAVYSTKNIGHFGLAMKYYTHFTSPIRRYPDMLVHRVLNSHLTGKPIGRREYVNLEKLCIEASQQEAKAVDAERESIKYKQVEYMTKHIGKTFDAIISGVTDWGLYVEEKMTAAEGLVSIRSLGSEYFARVPSSYSLVGQQSKKKFVLGDGVRVRLVAADVGARTIDFELV